MKTQEFDRRFDDGEDITAMLDLSQAQRPWVEQHQVSINLPTWMIERLNQEAIRLGVTPQTIVETSLATHLAIHHPAA
jgi:hypothetical protein